MRKPITIISFLILFSMSLFADVFVVNDSTTNLGAKTSFDLSKSYSVPKVSMVWNAKDEAGNTVIGSANFLGMFGTKSCTHRIKVTVSTDGRFVSQSDPTKYREFAVSFRAVYGQDGVNTNGNFKWFPEGEMKQTSGIYYAGYALSDSNYWPNTYTTGSFDYYSPRTDGTTQYVGDQVSSVIRLFYMDMCIYMPELTTESMKHLAEKDDYMATITINWECAEPDAAGHRCNEQGDHIGAKTMIIRGYYGDPGSATNDAAYVYVIPNNNSTSIDIKALAMDSSATLNIGHFQVHTATKTTSYNDKGTGQAYNWAKNTKVWASSTPAPTAAANNFLLAQVNGTKTIPYVVSLWDESDTNKLVTFDGTGYCGGSTFKVTGNTLDLATYGIQNTSKDRYGNSYADVHFNGNIHVEIPNPPSDLMSNIEQYTGTYTSYIYFNIMTNL